MHNSYVVLCQEAKIVVGGVDAVSSQQILIQQALAFQIRDGGHPKGGSIVLHLKVHLG